MESFTAVRKESLEEEITVLLVMSAAKFCNAPEGYVSVFKCPKAPVGIQVLVQAVLSCWYKQGNVQKA